LKTPFAARWGRHKPTTPVTKGADCTGTKSPLLITRGKDRIARHYDKEKKGVFISREETSGLRPVLPSPEKGRKNSFLSRQGRKHRSILQDWKKA